MARVLTADERKIVQAVILRHYPVSGMAGVMMNCPVRVTRSWVHDIAAKMGVKAGRRDKVEPVCDIEHLQTRIAVMRQIKSAAAVRGDLYYTPSTVEYEAAVREALKGGGA